MRSVFSSSSFLPVRCAVCAYDETRRERGQGRQSGDFASFLFAKMAESRCAAQKCVSVCYDTMGKKCVLRLKRKESPHYVMRGKSFSQVDAAWLF